MEWISCKERLPDKQDRYLIFGQFTKDCPNQVYEALYLKKPRRFMADGIYSKNVTHWMPLPEPPKTK
jgi:hypothetical protein